MRVAVVGAGIAGLAAARALDRRAEVDLFEAAPRPGGHAWTVEVEDGGARHRIDIGFIVYNRRNYPVFSKLLDELGVETAPASMSFSVSCSDGGFEYGAEDLGGLFARRANWVDPRFWGIVAGQARFWRAGTRSLEAAATSAAPSPALSPARTETVDDFCRRARLPRSFVELYLLPMGGAIWSAPPGEVRSFPARTLLAFFRQHGLLKLVDRPRWRTVVGGSARYVEALVGGLRGDVHLGTPVRRIVRRHGRVRLELDGGHRDYDRVVLATHSDRALRLLDEPTPAERKVLGAIRYRENDVALHRDTSLLPRRRRAWAAWNVRLDGAESSGVGVTYWMNRLQPLHTPSDWCVTLNRSASVDPAAVAFRTSLAHPQLDTAAVAAQARWKEIDGTGGIHYAGAYWRWGFHEDGAWSGERAALAALAAPAAVEVAA